MVIESVRIEKSCLVFSRLKCAPDANKEVSRDIEVNKEKPTTQMNTKSANFTPLSFLTLKRTNVFCAKSNVPKKGSTRIVQTL